MADNAAICTKCGVAKGTGKKFCYNCKAELNENQAICIKCGVALAAAPKGETLTGKPETLTKAVSGFIAEIKGLLKPATLPPKTPEIEALAAGPRKNLGAYLLLAIFFGGLGIHNFYAGYRQRAVTTLLCTVIPPCCCITSILSLIGVILDILKTRCDAAGRPMV